MHTKNISKPDLQKSNEKVPEMSTPEPQKVGFRLRGASIFTNPTNLEIVTKSHQKGSHLGASFDKKSIFMWKRDATKTHRKTVPPNSKTANDDRVAGLPDSPPSRARFFNKKQQLQQQESNCSNNGRSCRTIAKHIAKKTKSY